jgi:hypothetical protein
VENPSKRFIRDSSLIYRFKIVGMDESSLNHGNLVGVNGLGDSLGHAPDRLDMAAIRMIRQSNIERAR